MFFHHQSNAYGINKEKCRIFIRQKRSIIVKVRGFLLDPDRNGCRRTIKILQQARDKKIQGDDRAKKEC
jgi:hypothetical protein